jgi:preprotein translocase subunit SecE
MAKTNPGQFIQQVRQEVSKVTWPNRRETVTSAGMVFVMAILAALFFFLVDLVIGGAMNFILRFGG